MNRIAVIEHKTSGKKTVTPKRAAWVHRHLIDGAYEVQLHAEKLMLQGMGYDLREVRQVINIWRPKKGNWVDRVFADKSPLNVWWGSARSSVAERSDFQPLTEIVAKLMRMIAEAEESIIHGSSTTGCMGLADSAFVAALVATYGEDWKEICKSHLYTIPLHWRSEKMTEIAAKNGDPRDRCPHHLKITDRTADFFVKQPERVFTLPGGLGSYFEILFLLLSIQLREVLCTVASTWKKIPPLFLMDYQQDLDFRALIEAGVNMEELGLGSSPWYWQDFFTFLMKNVATGTLNQSDLDRVYLLRLGKGNDYDLSSKAHRGPRIRYFLDDSKLAEFAMNLVA